MKRGEKQAKAAIAERLQRGDLPVMLYTLSCVADQAAIAAGRRGELFPSLFDYENLVPEGFKIFWKQGYTTGAHDRILVVGTEEQCLAERTSTPMPGVFDAGVDLGPQFAKAS